MLPIFWEAARLSTEVELGEWDKQVEGAKAIAQNDMGVQFIDVDIQVWKDAVADVQQQMLESNPNIQELYDHIQAYNAQYE